MTKDFEKMYLQYITNSKRNTSSALYLIVTVAPFAQELIDYAFHESCLATRIIEVIETRKRKETKAEGPKISSYLVDGSRLAIRLARIRYVTSAYTMNKIATGARASPTISAAVILRLLIADDPSVTMPVLSPRKRFIVSEGDPPASNASNPSDKKRRSVDIDNHCNNVRSFAKNVFGSIFIGMYLPPLFKI